MAKIYITEYANVAVISKSHSPIAQEPRVQDQTVAIGGTSTQSGPFDAQTKFIRVETDAICSIAIGATPTATTGKTRLAADQTEYFGVSPGHKLAVIANT